MKKGVIISLLIVVCIAVITFLGKQSKMETIAVPEKESTLTITDFQYGAAQHQVGFKVGKGEGDVNQGVTSFFVKDQNIYLLDNVNKKIIVKNADDTMKEMKLDQSGQYEDIYVKKENTIYVLDSTNHKLVLLNTQGSVKQELKIPDTIEFPRSIQMDNKGNVYVQDGAGLSVAVDTSEEFVDTTFLENFTEQVSVKFIDKNQANILVGKDSIAIPFEHSFGGIEVLDVSEDSILFIRTEVAEDVPVVMIESFVERYDRSGKLLSAARIPLEQMTFVGNMILRVSEGKCYLLVHQRERIVVSEIIPGKMYEKRLQKQIDENTNE